MRSLKELLDGSVVKFVRLNAWAGNGLERVGEKKTRGGH